VGGARGTEIPTCAVARYPDGVLCGGSAEVCNPDAALQGLCVLGQKHATGQHVGRQLMQTLTQGNGAYLLGREVDDLVLLSVLPSRGR